MYDLQPKTQTNTIQQHELSGLAGAHGRRPTTRWILCIGSAEEWAAVLHVADFVQEARKQEIQQTT